MQLKLIRQALKSLFASHPAVFGDAEERDLLQASIAGPKTKVIAALAHALIKPDGTVIPADQVGTGGEAATSPRWETITGAYTITAADHGKTLLVSTETAPSVLTFSNTTTSAVVDIIVSDVSANAATLVAGSGAAVQSSEATLLINHRVAESGVILRALAGDTGIWTLTSNHETNV